MVNPRVIENIVENIFKDMSDRRGLDLSELDSETQADIRASWHAIVYAELKDRN